MASAKVKSHELVNCDTLGALCTQQGASPPIKVEDLINVQYWKPAGIVTR